MYVGMWALRNLKFRIRLYIMGSVSYLAHIPIIVPKVAAW